MAGIPTSYGACVVLYSLYLPDYPEAGEIGNAELLELPCEALIPAALGGQVNLLNAERIQARPGQ